MIVFRDTREKLPAELGDFETRVATLQAGDYSTEKLFGRAAIERKSGSDFIGTFFGDRARGMAQVQKLCALERAAIVVEAELGAILRGDHRVNTHSILGTIASITARHRLPILFAPGRKAAGYLIVGILGRWEQELCAAKEVA